MYMYSCVLWAPVGAPKGVLWESHGYIALY